MRKSLLDNIIALTKSNFFFPFLLVIVTISAYHKFFLFGKIPFPGDLLVTSYAPWFSYYKFPVQNPLISDIFSQFFLWKYLTIDIIKGLQWPLWNPYSFSGTPLLATYHSASLNPLNLLLLLPQYYGWGMFIFFQTFLAAFSMYLLLGRWLDIKIARFFGAIVFAFGGLMTTWTEFGTGVYTIAWLPLAILFIELYLNSHRLRYLLFLTISLSLIILSGNAQITTYAFAIITAFTLLRSWNKNLKTFLFNLVPIYTSLFFSISLTAPQLLPSFELLQKSIRLQDSYTKDYNFGLLPIKEIFKLFSSDFFGNPTKQNYWGFLNYSETSSFMGSMVIPMFIFVIIFLKKNSLIIFYLLFTVISLLLSFQNPLSEFIYQTNLPLLTSSYASRALFITNFSVSILIAFALNQILSHPNQEEKTFKSVLWAWAAFLGATIGIIIVRQTIVFFVTNAPSPFYKEFYLNDQDYSLNNYRTSLRNMVIPIFSISTLLILLISFKALKYFPKICKFNTSSMRLNIFSIILVGLSVLELNYYFLKFNPFVSQELVFPKTPALEYLQQQEGLFRVGREHAEVFPPNTWIAYGLQSIEGYDPLYLNEYGKFMHFLNNGDPRTGGTGRYAELSAKYSSPFLDAANVKYFVSILRDQNGYIPGDLVNFKFQDVEYEVVFKDRSTAVLKNLKALERAYFVSSFISNTDTKNLIMTDQSFDPRTTVALEEDLDVKSITGTGTVTITSYTPNEVILSTNTEHEEILVLADQYDEGWTAKIDGQDTKISRANLIFRAVKVPPGSHQITFSYQPKSFDLGLKISSVTTLAILLIFLFSIKKKSFESWLLWRNNKKN